MWRLHHCRCSLQLSLLICCLFLSSTFPRFLVRASDEGVKVRLVNGGTPYEGRLEVNYQGLWGTVCRSDTWTIKNDNVVCRQLGFPPASQTLMSGQFGMGTGPILLNQVGCRGDESGIDQCDHSGWFVHTCTHWSDVGVSCDLTTTPAVRLVNGTSSHEGRVEVYFKCQWGTIFGYSWAWGPKEADIVCRQLGYPSASRAWSGAHFGQGSLPIILSKVECNGNESSLAECDHDEWFNCYYCKHDQDVGVTCETSILSTVLVRLVNGSNPYEGGVEVYRDGVWGTVCGDNWGLNDAQVVCRQLGYPAATRAWQNSPFGRGAGPTLTWSNLTCDGNESSIAECGYGPLPSQGCTRPGGAAAVRCGEEHLMIEDTQTIPIRLVNGAGPHEGSVEVLYKCFWGSVTGYFLSIREGDVICRQLGFPSAYRVLRCGATDSTDHIPIRLVNGAGPHEGSVEVLYKCFWGSVTGYFLSIREADVICRQLGFPSAYRVLRSNIFAKGKGPVLLTNMKCKGDETSIDQCSRTEWFDNKRGLSHFYGGGVICNVEPQLPPPVRLVNGNTPDEGRVEIYHQCYWGTVCSRTWTLQGANVICRQLGYPSATHAWGKAHFGESTGLPLLSVRGCNGSESNILDCNHWGWMDLTYIDDVGVTCSKRIGLNSPSQVRLVNGTSPCEGRLEVYYKDQWGAVCNKGWSILESGVVCRQLHCPPATTRALQGAHFGRGQGRLLLDNVTCIGNETSIDQCYYSDLWSTDNCSHSEEVGVTCGEGAESSELHNVLSSANSSHAAVRLAGGQTPNEGRVEYFYKCSWGKMCPQGWSIRAADVVCRQLGYPSAAQAWHEPIFGRTAAPGLLDDVHCNGSESTLEQCNHSVGFSKMSLCLYGAAVTCDIKTPPVPVRLANSSFSYEGRVELFYGGQWGILFCKSWSIEMASIVCRQLGYPSALMAWPGGHFGSRVAPVLLMILSCRGNEESIDKCDHQGWFNNLRQSYSSVSVPFFGPGVTCDPKKEVYLPGICGTATSNGTDFGILTWPAATAGETVGSVERCPLTSLKAGSPRSVRECLMTDPPLWGNYTNDNCGEVTIDDVEESTPLLQEASSIATPVKKSLSFITQVSCVVSIVAFTVTLVVNLAARKLGDTNGKAHHISVHLSLSVIALYGLFLGGVDKAKDFEPICTIVSASLHYFTLTTMIWMTVEARDICRTLKGSSEVTTLEIALSCLIAWGSPVVAVLSTLMTPEDSYHNENYCFMTFGLPMYLGLFTPMVLLLIANILLYLLAVHSLYQVHEVLRVRQIAKRLQNAVGVFALMSLTWCFGFLVIDTSTPTYEVVFCTVSSVQAVFVCVMCCVQQEEVCRSVACRFKCACRTTKKGPSGALSP